MICPKRTPIIISLFSQCPSSGRFSILHNCAIRGAETLLQRERLFKNTYQTVPTALTNPIKNGLLMIQLFVIVSIELHIYTDALFLIGELVSPEYMTSTSSQSNPCTYSSVANNKTIHSTHCWTEQYLCWSMYLNYKYLSPHRFKVVCIIVHNYLIHT